MGEISHEIFLKRSVSFIIMYESYGSGLPPLRPPSQEDPGKRFHTGIHRVKQQFSITHCNVRSLPKAKRLTLLRKCPSDILVFTETRQRTETGGYFYLDNFHWFLTPCAVHAGIWVGLNQTQFQLWRKAGSRWGFFGDRILWIALPGIAIIAIYAPTADKANREKTQEFYHTLNTCMDKMKRWKLKPICIGDFNARIPKESQNDTNGLVGKFGYYGENNNSEDFIDFLLRQRMVVGNTCFRSPTKRRVGWLHQATKKRYSIDHILIPHRDMIKRCKSLLNCDHLTDHRPQRSVIGVRPNKMGLQRTWKTASTQNGEFLKDILTDTKATTYFREQVDSLLVAPIEFERDIPNMARHLADVITTAEHLTRSQYTAFHPKQPWYSDDVFIKLYEQKRIAMLEQRQHDAKQLGRRLFKRGRQLYQNWLTCMAGQIDDHFRKNRPRAAWKLIKTVCKDRAPELAIRHPAVGGLGSPGEIAELLACTYENLSLVPADPLASPPNPLPTETTHIRGPPDPNAMDIDEIGDFLIPPLLHQHTLPHAPTEMEVDEIGGIPLLHHPGHASPEIQPPGLDMDAIFHVQTGPDLPACPIYPGLVTATIHSLRNNKTSGFDQITAEHLKAAGPRLLASLTTLYAECWEQENIPQQWGFALILPILKPGKHPTNPLHYRPIALLSVLVKTYATIIHQLLTPYAELILNERQGGFRRMRSTTTHILNLKNIISYRGAERQETFVAFLDLTRAYDSIPRESLWRAMRALHIPEKLVRVCASLYDDVTYAVVVNNIRSTTKTNPVGLRQGCPLSPVLFNLYLEYITRELETTWDAHSLPGVTLLTGSDTTFDWPPKLNTRHTLTQIRWLGYADDLALVSSSYETLDQMVRLADTGLQHHGMTLNWNKSEFVRFSPFHTTQPPARRNLCDGRLLQAPHFKYLGVWLTESLSEEMDTKYRKTLCLAAAGKLRRITAQKQIPRRIQSCLLDSCVFSRLAYSGETLTLSKTQTDHINRLERRCVRLILDIKWYHFVPNTSLHQKWGNTSTWSAKLLRRRLRFTGHLCRRDPTFLTRKIFFSSHQGGHRKGRRLTWRKEIAKTLHNTPVRHTKNKRVWKQTEDRISRTLTRGRNQSL